MDPFRRASHWSQPQLATTLPLYSGSETVGSQSVRPAVSVVLGQARRARPIIPAQSIFLAREDMEPINFVQFYMLK